MALNAKQRLFVKEYLKDKNASRAARAAGYGARNSDVTGPRLLGNAGIRKEVDKGLADLARKTDISAERVIKRIAEIAFQPLAKNDLKKNSATSLKALEMLGKHFKLFTEVTELTGKDGGAVQVVYKIPAALKARAKEGKEE